MWKTHRSLSRFGTTVVATGFAVLADAGCSDECSVDETFDPVIDPSAFVATIDHPYLPLIPGTVATYEGEVETIVVTVTSEKRTILGVPCTVVHDVAMIDGEVIEDTYDWYAQDRYGNVWYFGEDTKELENGRVVSTEGSWEAGVRGAKPGIVMQANPVPGVPYQQEYFACHAEDRAEVTAIGVSETVPYGSFAGCVRTHDYTPLEPDQNEQKTYCEGIGLVSEDDLMTGERTELVALTTN